MSTSFKIIKLKVEYTLKYLNLNDNITALPLVYKTYYIIKISLLQYSFLVNIRNNKQIEEGKKYV